MRRRTALTAALICVAASATAAASQETPARPKLPAAADTNDWEAYYDQGVTLLRDRHQLAAEAYFHWAARLDPTRAEPLYARWVAFWARDPKRYFRWSQGDQLELGHPDVIRMDSVQRRAFARNPLVYQGLHLLIVSQVPNLYLPGDPGTQGWVAYSQLQLPRAAELLQRAITREPGKPWLRYERALVFTAQQRLDSATAEMQRLLADLRARDAKVVDQAYQSKAFVEYTIGRLAHAQRDSAAAREAFGRALAEDLGYVAAHAWMGNVALERGDVETALREYALAVELTPRDGMLRWLHGRALGASGRDEEAIAEFRRAIELEPDWAEPWFSLALALDREALPREALDAYRTYLARAPRTSPNLARARSRVETLSAAR